MVKLIRRKLLEWAKLMMDETSANDRINELERTTVAQAKQLARAYTALVEAEPNPARIRNVMSFKDWRVQRNQLLNDIVTLPANKAGVDGTN